MSSVNAPFGLRAAFKSGGIVASTPLQNTIASAYAANIYQGAPVKIGTNGTLELAAVGERFVGVFEGVYYIPTTGRPVFDNKWISGTVLATGTIAYAFYTADQQITFEIQANGSMTQTNMGQQFDMTTTSAGNATTGQSSVSLDTASSAANASLRVVGITPGPDNDWGDAFTVVQVQISEHQNVADVAAY
jgi:hypothetical protein